VICNCNPSRIALPLLLLGCGVHDLGVGCLIPGRNRNFSVHHLHTGHVAQLETGPLFVGNDQHMHLITHCHLVLNSAYGQLYLSISLPQVYIAVYE
jgi:hypothetical protein